MSAGSSRRLMRSPTSFGSTVAMALSPLVSPCACSPAQAQIGVRNVILSWKGKTTLRCVSEIPEVLYNSRAYKAIRFPCLRTEFFKETHEVVGMFFLHGEDGLHHTSGRGIVVAKISDHIAVAIDGDTL